MNPKNSKLTIPFFIFINSLLVFFIWQYPNVMDLKNSVDTYREAISEDMPSIRFADDGIDFLGILPYTKELRNGVIVHIDNDIDTVLFKSFPEKSIWLSEDTLFYRRHSDITKISLKSIHSDPPEVYTGAEIKLKVEKSFDMLFTVGLLILLGLTFLVLLLLTLLGAGMGSIVDAFSEGPYNYKHMLKIASFFQFVWLLVAVVGYFLGITHIGAILPILVFYLLSIMGFVYYLVHRDVIE